MKVLVFLSFMLVFTACQKADEANTNAPAMEKTTEATTEGAAEKSAAPCAEGDVAKELETDGLEKKSGCSFDGSVTR
jgi:hypothetical protein